MATAAIAPEVPPVAEEKKAAWKVESVNRPNLLEEKLLELDKAGFWIYKVMCNPHGDYVIIAKPRSGGNAMLSQAKSIAKSLSAFLKMAEEQS